MSTRIQPGVWTGESGKGFIAVALTATPILPQDDTRKYVFLQNIVDPQVVTQFNRILLTFDEAVVWNSGGIVLLPGGHFEGWIFGGLTFSAVNAIAEPGAPGTLPLTIQIGR